MMPGLHISLMGIDGAGKTSIATRVVQSLRAKGYSTQVVSWKSAINGGEQVGHVLGSISMAAYKLQFAEAEPLGDAYSLRERISMDSVSEFFNETEQALRSVAIKRNSAHPLLSAALLELAGNYYLHQCHVSPLTSSGIVVIEESCGFKHALKNALMAGRLEAGSAVQMLHNTIIEAASRLFGEVMKPNVGYWVDTDPRLALAWRDAGNVTSTNFEDYGVMGTPRDAASFLSMQNDCRTHFARFANRWGWTRLEMLDAPIEQNLHAAASTIEELVAREFQPR